MIAFTHKRTNFTYLSTDSMGFTVPKLCSHDGIGYGMAWDGLVWNGMGPFREHDTI